MSVANKGVQKRMGRRASKYAREPYSVSVASERSGWNGISILDADGKNICTMVMSLTDNERATANRIADCVNACVGMGNPMEETKPLRRAIALREEPDRKGAKATEIRGLRAMLAHIRDALCTISRDIVLAQSYEDEINRFLQRGKQR